MSFLTVATMVLFLGATSCNQNKTNEEMSQETPEMVETADSMDVTTDVTENSAATQNVITQNEGKYPREVELFGDNEIANRIKKLVGAEFEEISKNFQVETPIVSENNVYKFSGCQQHSCPSFHTTVVYDANNDNLNVMVDKDGKVQNFNEKGEITLTETLKMK
ncbi:hypothetical protein ACF3NR_09665 [Vaginella massiliensis]